MRYHNSPGRSSLLAMAMSLPLTAALDCIAQKPVVTPGEAIWVMAYGVEPAAQVSWQATAGRVSGSGARVIWSFTESGAKEQTITGRTQSGAAGECSLRIVVLAAGGDRSALARAVLIAGQREAPNYAAYNYLLLPGAPADASTRDRYLKTLEAWRVQIEPVLDMERYYKVSQLNLTYVPAKERPPRDATAEWFLEHYDYPRAKIILAKLPPERTRGRGPYLVTSVRGLTSALPVPKETLVQDLTHAAGDTPTYWVEYYMRKAAQPDFWKAGDRQSTLLQVRTFLERAGEGFEGLRSVLGKGTANIKEIVALW